MIIDRFSFLKNRHSVFKRKPKLSTRCKRAQVKKRYKQRLVKNQNPVKQLPCLKVYKKCNKNNQF